MQSTVSRSYRPLALSSVLVASFGLVACMADIGGSNDIEARSDELTVALQGETQNWTASSSDTISKSSTTARLQANASGDWFSFNAPVTSGTYTVVVRYAKRNAYGNFRVEANGAAIGTLSGYQNVSTDTWYTATLANVTVSGTTTFRFVNTGKDSASTDYDIKIDWIELRNGSTSPTPTSTGTSTPPPTSTGTSTPPPPPPSGSPSCTIPTATGTQSVSATIQVSGTFDGQLKRYVGAGALGSGTQDESQPPMFQLADGATLRNVILGAPAADGVHCRGTCTLENVYWEDVGEDAATHKGSSSSHVMTIVGGVARSASDKVFQHNGPGTMNIRNFCAESIGKLYRSCGNCSTQYKRNVNIDNVIVRSASSVAGINTNYGDVARFTRLTVSGNPSICDKYRGVTSGEPTKIGSGADGVNCIYSSADIIRQ